ncbi:hypothetical protein ACOMHN_042020 [Nucella lapillus]
MQVTFLAHGSEKSVESTEARFKLHVRDVNDNAPQFQNLPYNAEVDEDATKGTSVNININAKDVDTGAGGTVQYQLEDQGSPSFNSSTDLFITVKDVQDSPPVFVNIPYVASVHEGDALMSPVLTVRAVDQDRAIPNAVTYNVTDSTCPGLFGVDALKGVIYVASDLDTDTSPMKDLNGLCTIQLQATEIDSGKRQEGNITATARASINVLDINDNSPYFSQTSFSASITENAPAGTPLQLPQGQHITVTDLDQGSNGAIHLSLVNGEDTFELTTSHVQSNGSVQLRVKHSTQLDYERVQTLTVKILAKDGGQGHRSATATVTVTVVNVNEFSPQFTQVDYTATVPEGSQPPTSVITITATDKDAGHFGNITYTLNNARGLFSMDARSGAVTVASDQTDREREDRYYLMVVATDGGGLQQTVPLTLTISDVNDNPPVFLRHQYDVILNEDSTEFSRNVTLQVTDADENGTDNSRVTYSISETRPGGLKSHFHVDPTSGHLRVVQAVDYDVLHFPPSSEGIVDLVMVATDHGTPKRLSATANVVITLTDLNDETPVLQNTPYTAAIPEGSKEGTLVFTITATDADGSAPNNLITYSIESGGQDRFRVQPDTGKLTVSGQLDREQVSSYTLVIVARDRAAAPKSSSSVMTIRIMDVNDQLPSFGENENARIRVNESVGGKLYDMSAIDPDLNSALRYEIIYGESSAQPDSVDIQEWIGIELTTGEVIAKKALNRTEVHSFILHIRVTDINGSVHTPQIKDATLTITVEDINNHRPQFAPTGIVPATIRENMGTGTALTFSTPLRVFDMDEGVNSLFAVTVSGQSSAYFEVLPAIVQSSADLLVRVKNNSILDYERHTSLNITLLARETQTSSRGSSVVMIEVSLEDENDHSPHFDNDTYLLTIPEAQPAGTTLTVITATDADRSQKFSRINYSLQGAENIFTIDSSSGAVTLLTSDTDYDTLPNTYQLTVLASDSGGRRGDALLVVTLTDINDLSPRFDRPVYSAILREEHTQFESPLVVNAVDGDEPGTPASNITYTLSRSQPEEVLSSFHLPDRYSGVIEIASPLDLESLPSAMVNLTLQATDGGGRLTSAFVEIQVMDVNDHMPTFLSPEASSDVASVFENVSVGTVVYTFNATDADRTSPNNKITYLISSGANDHFSLDQLGHLTVSRVLDREEVSSYSLVVLALDRGVPQNTGSTTLSVVVSDVNDVSPQFVQSSVTIDVDENMQGVVYTMNAIDKDVDHQLLYEVVWADSKMTGSLSDASFEKLFKINKSTGAISIHGVLDRETLDYAVLAVQVRDLKSQTGLQTATGRVSITVVDEDDNPPVFSSSSLTVSVDENAAQGVPVNMPQISVTDPDQIWAEGTKNSNLRAYCNITVQINNLNDNLPHFQRSEYMATIKETSSTGTSVTTVKATDKDSGSFGIVSYSILGENTLFSVDNTSGLIVTSATADHYNFEKTPEYYLTVMAMDGGGATTTTRVHVLLLDINDQTPVFHRPEYSAFLKENAHNFDKGVTVKATDNDQPDTPNSEVSYSMQEKSNFSINATSGEVGIVRPVDYEAVRDGVVTLTVLATDHGSPPLNSSVQIIITVQDENDFEPEFEQSTYVGNVTEGSQNTNILKVLATDKDGSAPNNEVFYLLAGGGQDKFKVDSSSGQVSTIGDIDREVKASYTLTIQAVDKGSPPQTATTTVTVHVNNVNDDPPRFDPPKVSTRVPEVQAPGTVVYSFSAIDNDEDALLRYRIVWDQSFGYDEDLKQVNQSVLQDAFSIQESSGNITINISLDRESLETATLVILVRDINAPLLSSLLQTATGTVNIQVMDTDDHPPAFTSSSYTASVVENSPEGIPIHLPSPVTITDPDKGTNGEFHLSLSTDCLRISPSNARGQATVIISVQRPSCFDYETIQHLDFRIFASGEGDSNFTTNASVHLKINNTNDEAPHFTQREYSTKVPENLNVSTVVFTIKATDMDSPPYNSFVYSLQGGEEVFSVDNVTGKVVVRKGQLDYETRQQYQLRVEARDIGGLRDSVALTVTLTDLNDNPPQFVRPQYQAFVLEGLMHFQRHVQVQAKDADGTEKNRGVLYSLSPTSQWSSHFMVNASTGLLQVAKPLDYEALGVGEEGVITLVVLATDQGHPPLTGSVNVTVTVQDINDNPPVFSSLHYMGNVTENQDPGVVITKVKATDGDHSAPNNEVFYVMASGGNDQFQVNSSSGVISTVASLDREQWPDYNLTVLAMDRGSPAFTVTTTVSVIVTNINDDPPSFLFPQQTVSFPETTRRGSRVAVCSATDGDANANLSYSLMWSQSTGLDDQQRPVSRQVLKDENAAFTLSLSNYTHCLEVLPSRARSEATVLIRVTDSTCFDYEQQAVADFEATDADKPPYDAITYSLQGGDGIFSMDNVTGEVVVRKGQLDYETRQQYQLRVEARDIGGLRDSVALTVTLTDLNDNPPQFVRPQYQAFVLENQVNFNRELDITATDLDTGVNKEISYAISSLSQLADNFTIDTSTGRLTILQGSGGLDYEALPNLDSGEVHLVVVACDLGTPSLCTNVSVFVTVRDVNDNEPIFQQSYHGNISENAILDTPLLIVSAKDSDGQAPNNNVFYVMSGTGSDKFKVDSSTGLISRAGKLDSDTEDFYNLTITAIDGGSPAKSSATFVTVNVIDVNDVPPRFDPKTRSVDVKESNELSPGASERVLATLWAVDPDQDSKLNYQVEWDRCRGFGPNQEILNVSVLEDAFEVDGRSGEVKVRGTHLDRETISRALLVVNVTDLNANGAPQNSTGNLTINVVDVNDHTPKFNQARYTAQIAENAVKDSVLHFVSTDQMNVTDLDTDQNCVFNISVEGPKRDYFTAEPLTARSFALVQLRVRNGSVLDYEHQHNITFNVTVSETSTADHFTDTVTVFVDITDVNDNSPTFRQNFSASIQENSPVDSRITRVQAFDEDSGTFGEITYSLEGDAARFAVHPSSGEVVTADGSLDRESRDIYLITVVATDGGGRRAGAPLTITITDDNDEVPRFQTNYSTRVLENLLLMSPPVVLLAEDGDLPDTPNSNLTYHLQSCAPVACPAFTVHETSGQLTLTTPLDYEHTTSVQLVVIAQDQGSDKRLTGTATVTVDVVDVNDMDPKFSQPLYFAYVDENSEKGTHVGNVSAHDGDGTSPNNVVFYVLDSGRGSDKFRVNSSTGVVTVGPGALLDRETDHSFNLTMLALDRGDPPLSSTATLSVVLRDINDERPGFSQDGVGRVISVLEDVGVGRVLEVVNATDPDKDSALEYSWVLEQSWATTDRDVRVDISFVSTWFSVNASTGAVAVNSELDRERAEVIVMKIRVNDTNGVINLPQTALATLTITLTDVNDNHPVISGSQSLRVSEALAVGTEVASYTAKDADRDQKVTFSILAEGRGYFNISPSGKLSLQRQIDRETTHSVNFTVIGMDNGIPPLASNVTIRVTVLDANDNDPQFQNTSYVFSIAENAPVNTLVVTINATDRDQGANANVTFDFADSVYDFVLNKTTGKIRVHKPLDRETIPFYTFGVAALDNPITDVKRRTIQQVKIIITDVNDNAPHFTNLGPADDGYTAQIDETKGPGDKVLSIQPGPVQAADKDEGRNGALSFYLISKDNVGYFGMHPKTGDMFVKGSIQGEAGLYNYTVTVADGGQTSCNISANLTIEVLDQNLNDPLFVGDYAHITPKPECSKVGTTIVTLMAKDDDRNKETNGNVQYFFDNTTSVSADLPYFSLDRKTGILTSALAFDRESQDLFQIGVIAQDKGVPNVRYSKPLKLTIRIDDGNDNGPHFNVSDYHFTVAEDRTNITVGQVYAQDADDVKSTCYTLEGTHKDYFNISDHTDRPADLLLVKALDREDDQQASFSLTITATDCTPATGVCDLKSFPPVFAKVHLTVSDVNDNPPNFTRPRLTFGLTSTADAGHVIANLQDYVHDPDLGANRVHAFYPVGDYEMDTKLTSSMGPESTAQLLSLSVNGTLSTRSVLPGDAEGFFTWTVMANDSAGHDTVLLKIYVVGKDKLIKISFFTSVEELRQMQDDIVRDLSKQTGLQFVADDREPFEDSSGIDPSKSVLVAHAVDEKENAMDANLLMDFLDHQVVATDFLKTRYKLYNIQTYKAAESNAGDDLKKTEYILGAIICVLVIAFFITLYLMLNNIRSRHSDVSLDNNSVGLESLPAKDSLGLDEQEVILDLYGEDTEKPFTAGKDTFYLDQALAEHERQKNGDSQSSSLSRKPSHLTNGDLHNGNLYNGIFQTVDFEFDDLNDCESSDI